ncbi:hypothetical protein L1887_02769 [Cichorium endivia]|nr:hypothetical protein L1887_02769 [Cichorium endivia]
MVTLRSVRGKLGICSRTFGEVLNVIVAYPDLQGVVDDAQLKKGCCIGDSAGDTIGIGDSVGDAIGIGDSCGDTIGDATGDAFVVITR